MTHQLEHWVTTQIAPAKHIVIYERGKPNAAILAGHYATAWLIQELRNVNGHNLPAPYATRVIAGHVVNGQLEAIDPATHNAYSER